jgi:hydantoinase/carbamoylase family amidase
VIDKQRLRGDLEELSRIGRLSSGGVSRPAFGAAEIQARHWFIRKLEEAGLEVGEDEAGNISGRLPGAGPTVLSGSHLDTIENGGAFDGALGVLGALECLRVIRERNLTCSSAVEVIAFSDEEEAFLSFLGSSALTGQLSKDELDGARNPQGLELRRAMADYGLDIDAIRRARRDPAGIRAFVELHIEQGPILAEQGVSVGVVEAVKGNYRYGITLGGRRDHAGIPMRARRDPMFAATALIERLRACIGGIGPEVLMTVGQFTVEPGLENVIPGSVYFSVDFRDENPGVLSRLEARLHDEIERLRRETTLDIQQRPLLRIDPVAMDPAIQAAIKQAAQRLDVGWLPLSSGAGHDAQVLGRFVPAGMIFVPSRGGRSHCPEEYTDWSDIRRATEVLLAVILHLAAMD